MKTNQTRAVEMPGRGKRGKPNGGFPRFPQPLEIAVAIPTFPQRRRVRLFLSKPKPRKEPSPIRLHLARSGSSFDEKMLTAPTSPTTINERI